MYLFLSNFQEIATEESSESEPDVLEQCNLKKRGDITEWGMTIGYI